MEANTPKYSAHDHSSIDLNIHHPRFGWLPFTARADDVESTGADLYARAVAGEFGPIAPYEAPADEEQPGD